MKTKILFTLLLILSFHVLTAQKLSIQTGHSAGITDLVFSPDGQYLFSSGEDSKVILWDMSSSKQMNILSGHSKTVNALAVHPSKNIIASASDDNTVKIWDYPSGNLLKTYSFFEKSVKSLAFSRDGMELACGADYVYLINIQTSNHKKIGKESRKGYNAVNYSNDGEKLAFGGKKTGKLFIYNTYTEKISSKINVHANDLLFDKENKNIYAAGNRGNIRRLPLDNSFLKKKFNISANHSWHAFNSIVLNQEFFIAANKDNLIYIYNKNSGAREEIFKAHDDEVLALAIAPDGRFLASAGKDRKIFIWDLKKRALIKTMEGGANRVNSISFSENGKLMFIAYHDGSFRIWNLDQKGKVIYQEHNKLNPLERYFRYKYSIDKTKEVFSPDKILIKANLNQKDKYSDEYKTKEALIVWELNHSIKAHTLKSPKTTNYQSFLVKDTSEILLFKSRGTHSQKYSLLDKKRIKEREEIFKTKVYNYNVSSGKKDGKLKVNFFKSHPKFKIKGDLYFKALSADDNLLLVLIKEKNVGTKCEIWDLESNNLVKSMPQDGIFNAAGFSSKDKYIYLTSTEEQIIKLFKLSDLSEEARFLGNAPIRFNPDDTQISFTDKDRKLSLVEIESKNEIFKVNSEHSSTISDIKFNMPYNYIATSSFDGLIKFWDIQSGDLLVSLAAFHENDFIYITSDNYYYSTKGAMDYIGFIQNDRLYTFEQFDVKFNRPDLVFSKLSYSTPDEIAAYKKAYIKRVQKMGFANTDLSGKLNIPDIKILNAEDIKITTVDESINMEILAKDSLQKIDRINIWVNDVPIFGMNGYSVIDQNTNSITKNFKVKLSAGRNKIQVSATNNKGFESLRETFSIIYDVKESLPDLYLITIGVSEYHNKMYNLQYAAKDADDVNAMFSNKSKQYGEVHSIKVLNKEATVGNVLKLKSELKNSKVDDVVVLFFAGHGVLDPEMNYYLATTEIDVNDMEHSALRYDYLEGLFDGIPARKKVIIIDACHSGEVDKEEEFADTGVEANEDNGFLRSIQSAASLETNTKITTQSSFELMKMMFADIRRGTGSTVISSAGGGEFAYETEQTKNGIFTYVLLDGIVSGKADLNKDGQIMVSELRDYVSTRVSKITKGSQNPTSRRENLEFDFQIW
ncbi:MAG: caspase family protein [Bacteroidales bacterium]|nr:caspase family protein [Bacteroidales bacterium]